MKSAGKARNNGLYRHIRTSKEIIRNLLNDSNKFFIDLAFYKKLSFQKTRILKLFSSLFFVKKPLFW